MLKGIYMYNLYVTKHVYTTISNRLQLEHDIYLVIQESETESR